MSLLFPIDQNGHPIPILGFAKDGTINAVATSSASTIEIPIANEAKVLTVISTGPIRMAIGDSSIEANNTNGAFLVQNTYMDIPVYPDNNFVSLLAVDTDCDVILMERN